MLICARCRPDLAVLIWRPVAGQIWQLLSGPAAGRILRPAAKHIWPSLSSGLLPAKSGSAYLAATRRPNLAVLIWARCLPNLAVLSWRAAAGHIWRCISGVSPLPGKSTARCQTHLAVFFWGPHAGQIWPCLSAPVANQIWPCLSDSPCCQDLAMPICCWPNLALLTCPPTVPQIWPCVFGNPLPSASGCV